MIVYKWVYKKDNKYFPLVNFRIIPSIKKVNCDFYEIGKVYYQYKDILSNHFKNINIRRNTFHIAGFHFWKELKNKRKWEQYNNCLSHYKQPQINSILKCQINEQDIINQDNERIVAKRFKVLEEANDLPNM